MTEDRAKFRYMETVRQEIQQDRDRISVENDKLSQDVLLEAASIIQGDRNVAYGEPEDCFGLIANYWNIYMYNKKTPDISTHDVAMMMCLLKIARANASKKKDNYVDIAGYAALAARL